MIRYVLGSFGRGNDRNIVGTLGLMALGNAVSYVAGATWPAMYLHLNVRAPLKTLRGRTGATRSS